VSDELRLKVTVRGAVQGVGFRPFVFRLASELGLKGWVKNSTQGVFIEVEGARSRLEQFLLRLEAEKPPRCSIQSLEPSWLDRVGYGDFEIRPSDSHGARTTLVLPDIATCSDCLREVFDPANRRYFYPFTNCTHCGPRFSIIEALPYDRPNTSMKKFRMCGRCQAEYEDPRDRRFHAQPNACPVCGPRLQLWDSKGKVLAGGGVGGNGSRQVLEEAATALCTGKIVAVKSLGGFHLMVAAHDEAAVRRLRDLKHREEKPLAVMFPSLETVRRVCEVSAAEERLLRSPESPIELLRSRMPTEIQAPAALIPASAVAPGNPNLGVLLPYTPLHHLLLSLLEFPVVATSGNLSDEPICTDEHEALVRLGNIADLFLVHDRPIVRHVDDSIVRIIAGREQVLRRARGYAPLPVTLRAVPARPEVVLAVGAHLKNAVALAVGGNVFVSQHIGDLETDQAYAAFTRVITDFERLYEAHPGTVACDAHPGYPSAQFAIQRTQQEVGRPGLARVQHHLAHVLSCMAENELEPPVLGVAWDGTGYGLDGTIWGGEFLKVEKGGSERIVHLRPFPLPGGEQAVKEPRRSLLGVLYELFGQKAFAMTHLAAVRAFSAKELASLKTMLARGLNSPRTSSVGRLFDAVASLAGLRQQTRFEGQAAMELEFALEGFSSEESYELQLLKVPSSTLHAESGHAVSGGLAAAPEATVGEMIPTPSPRVLDWAPMLRAMLSDLSANVPVARISAKFHNGLAEAIIAVARQTGLKRVVLSGGCFQNRYLTERTIHRLREAGFLPYWHQRVPPNDGGIALGQVLACAKRKT
jgi:hydrogenase maturation protein HypF